MVGARGAAVSCSSCVLPVAGLVKGLEFGGKMGTHDLTVQYVNTQVPLENERNLQGVCCVLRGWGLSMHFIEREELTKSFQNKAIESISKSRRCRLNGN